jgi:hypothetical protein
MSVDSLRYPLVGGTRQRYFDGTHFKPRELPENVQTPTSRVHAVLAAIYGVAVCVFGNRNNHLNKIPVVHPIPTSAIRGLNAAKRLRSCLFDR